MWFSHYPFTLSVEPHAMHSRSSVWILGRWGIFLHEVEKYQCYTNEECAMPHNASENMWKTTQTNHCQVKMKTDPATDEKVLKNTFHWAAFVMEQKVHNRVTMVNLVWSQLTHKQSVCPISWMNWMWLNDGAFSWFCVLWTPVCQHHQLHQGTHIKRGNLGRVTWPCVKWGRNHLWHTL